MSESNQLSPQEELKQLTEQMSLFRARQKELKEALNVGSEEIKQAKANTRAIKTAARAETKAAKSDLLKLLGKLSSVLKSDDPEIMHTFIEKLEAKAGMVGAYVADFAQAIEDLETLNNGEMPKGLELSGEEADTLDDL